MGGSSRSLRTRPIIFRFDLYIIKARSTALRPAGQLANPSDSPSRPQATPMQRGRRRRLHWRDDPFIQDGSPPTSECYPLLSKYDLPPRRLRPRECPQGDWHIPPLCARYIAFVLIDRDFARGHACRTTRDYRAHNSAPHSPHPLLGVQPGYTGLSTQAVRVVRGRTQSPMAAPSAA